MNNSYKKLISFVLALAMVFTGSAMAFATQVEPEPWAVGASKNVENGNIKLDSVTTGEAIALQSSLLEWAKTKVEIEGQFDSVDINVKLELDPTTMQAISNPVIQINTKSGIMGEIREVLSNRNMTWAQRQTSIAAIWNRVSKSAIEAGNEFWSVSGSKVVNLVASLGALLSPEAGYLDIPYAVGLFRQFAELGEDRFKVYITFGNKGVYGDGDIQIQTTITELINVLEGVSQALTQYIGTNVSNIASATIVLGSFWSSEGMKALINGLTNSAVAGVEGWHAATDWLFTNNSTNAAIRGAAAKATLLGFGEYLLWTANALTNASENGDNIHDILIDAGVGAWKAWDAWYSWAAGTEDSPSPMVDSLETLYESTSKTAIGAVLTKSGIIEYAKGIQEALVEVENAVMDSGFVIAQSTIQTLAGAAEFIIGSAESLAEVISAAINGPNNPISDAINAIIDIDEGNLLTLEGLVNVIEGAGRLLWESPEFMEHYTSLSAISNKLIEEITTKTAFGNTTGAWIAIGNAVNELGDPNITHALVQQTTGNILSVVVGWLEWTRNYFMEPAKAKLTTDIVTAWQLVGAWVSAEIQDGNFLDLYLGEYVDELDDALKHAGSALSGFAECIVVTGLIISNAVKNFVGSTADLVLSVAGILFDNLTMATVTYGAVGGDVTGVGFTSVAACVASSLEQTLEVYMYNFLGATNQKLEDLAETDKAYFEDLVATLKAIDAKTPNQVVANHIVNLAFSTAFGPLVANKYADSALHNDVIRSIRYILLKNVVYDIDGYLSARPSAGVVENTGMVCTISVILNENATPYAFVVPFNGGAKLTVDGYNVKAVTVTGINNQFFTKSADNKTITFNNITRDVNCTIETNIEAYTGGGSTGGYSGGGGGGSAAPAKKEPVKVETVWKDVDTKRYYYDAMQWAFDEGIMEADETNKFGIGDNVSRAEFFNSLYKAAGSPKVASTATTPFTDVSKTADYYKAVVWAVTEGLTNGAGANDVFAPDMELDRAQIVTILWRYAGSKVQEGKIDFTDVEAGRYYTQAVDWSTANGIINGTGDGTTFSPFEFMLKESAITMLYRKFVKALF